MAHGRWGAGGRAVGPGPPRWGETSPKGGLWEGGVPLPRGWRLATACRGELRTSGGVEGAQGAMATQGGLQGRQAWGMVEGSRCR